MITVFYSYHGTSVYNAAKLAAGQTDVPLAQSGKEQAQLLGQHYASQALDAAAVFCSDLQRAVTTAQIVFSERGLPLIPDARLRECNYGEMAGGLRSQMEEEFPHRVKVPFPGGESVSMVVQRMGAFLRDALATYDGKTVIVIGHRTTQYSLKYWSSNIPLEELVQMPFEWREVPIYRYEIHARALIERAITL